jgi:hypothetical protein
MADDEESVIAPGWRLKMEFCGFGSFVVACLLYQLHRTLLSQSSLGIAALILSIFCLCFAPAVFTYICILRKSTKAKHYPMQTVKIFPDDSNDELSNVVVPIVYHSDYNISFCKAEFDIAFGLNRMLKLALRRSIHLTVKSMAESCTS